MKIFRKQTTILVAVICFCLLFSVSVLAEVCGDFEYVVTEDNTCKITGYTGQGGDVTIPSTLDGYTVCDFELSTTNDNIESMTLPATIPFDDKKVSISFENCNELKRATFLGNVNCERYKSYIYLGEIEELSFYGNVYLDYEYCYGNEYLRRLNFFGKTVFEWGCFYKAKALEEVNFFGETILGEDCFSESEMLTSVSFNNGIRIKLPERAFYGCSALKNVRFNNGSVCEELKENAFARCSALEEITIPTGAPIKVGDRCFDNCTKLKRFVIQGDKAEIGVAAFNNCEVLEDFIVQEGVLAIGENAFYGCKNLNNLIMGESLLSIDNEAFRGCTKLASIMLPSTVTVVDEMAFFGCNAALYTKIGSETAVSLSRAGYTFMDPDYPGISLMHTFHQNEVSGFEVVGADTAMASAVIPQSVTAVGKSAFSGCTLLNHVSFPESLNEIGQSAFYDCRRLKEVYIPETVTSIGDSAFNPNTTIYCYEYTVAEAWANRNGFKVVLLDQKPFEEIGRITLPEQLYVQNGTQKTVTAEIFPNTPDLVPVWTSSDPTVATVSEDGILSALRNGETTLTLTVKGKTAQCTVHVVTMAEDFTIPAELYVQAKKSIAAPVPAVTPEDATVHLEWSADNVLAVEISPAGSITGYVVGDTVLTAKDTISGLTKTVTLHIVRPVSAISVTPAAAGLIPYEPLQLTAQGRIGTTEIGEVGVTWTSEDLSVAVVDESGRVQALAPGRTRIVATFDGRATAACTLTVREAATIRLPASLKTVSANALTGTTAELYILPDSVERIESGAFANLQYARVIVIPEGAAAGTEADAFAGTDAVLVHPDGTPFEP